MLREKALLEEQLLCHRRRRSARIKRRVDLSPATSALRSADGLSDVLAARRDEVVHHVDVEEVAIEDRIRHVLLVDGEERLRQFPRAVRGCSAQNRGDRDLSWRCWNWCGPDGSRFHRAVRSPRCGSIAGSGLMPRRRRSILSSSTSKPKEWSEHVDAVPNIGRDRGADPGVAGTASRPEKIADVLDDVTPVESRQGGRRTQRTLSRAAPSYRIREIAGGFQYYILPEYAGYVEECLPAAARCA